MVLALVAFMLVLMPSVHAVTTECVNCADCNAKIQTASYGDVVTLTADITNYDGTCIDFNGKDSITFDGDNHTIDGAWNCNGYGIHLSGNSNDNIIKNCEISDFRSGIYLFCSSNNTLQSLTSHSNDDGIKILYGDLNTVSDSVAQENDHYDFYFLPNTIGDCNNRLINVIGSGNRPIGFYNQSINLQDQEFSALYLCNADNSILNDITIRGSDSLNNNGLRMFYTDNSNLTDITSSHNFEGILLDDDTCANTLRNIKCNDNPHHGIMVQYGSDHNRLDEIETRSNGQCGIYLLSCSYNILTNSTSSSNSFAGVYIDRSSHTTINNSHITGNNICGINVNSGNSLIYNNYFCNDKNVNFAGTTVYNNDWNITNSSGPNIVGKPYIGGNYWSGYHGKDNNSDGFGDTPYNVNGTGDLNIDYLPLLDPPDIRVDPTTLNFKIAPAERGRDGKRGIPIRPPRSQPTEPVDRILVDGRPPEIIRAPAVSLPEPHIAAGINVLQNVPAFDWCYGCSATAAAMMMGYYDNNGYPNMYTGPANDGVCPLNNSVWGSGECPLSATHQSFDGLTVRGHVDDYWISYGSSSPDPYVTDSRAQQTWGNCTADFMGTNQDKFGSTDGATWFWYYTNGAALYDYYRGMGEHDGCYGMRRFVESRGYIVLENFNQYIYGYNGNSDGFTFDDYMVEIDAGRPVIIQVAGHSMLGFGYDNSSGQQIIYFYNTWNYNNYTMTWGGNYEGLTHYAVTVMRLAPADCPQQARVFAIIEDAGKSLAIDSFSKNESWITLDYPAASFNMVGYGQRAVIVRVNESEVVGGDSDVIAVYSNDPDECPVGVRVNVLGLCGDVDGNGILNILDVRLLMMHVADPTGYPVESWAGDVDGEGDIDGDDVQLLLGHVFDPEAHPLKCS